MYRKDVSSRQNDVQIQSNFKQDPKSYYYFDLTLEVYLGNQITKN